MQTFFRSPLGLLLLEYSAHILGLVFLVFGLVGIVVIIAAPSGARWPASFWKPERMQIRWGKLAGGLVYFAGYVILPLAAGAWLWFGTPAGRWPKWQVHIGNRPNSWLRAPVEVANGSIFVAAAERQPERFPNAEYYYFQALDAADGRFKWHMESSSSSATKPVAYNGLVLFSAPLSGVDAATGVPKWKLRTGFGSLVVKDGIIYTACACGKNAGQRGRVLAIDIHSGVSQWEIELEQPKDMAVAVDAGSVYYVDGLGLHAVERETGKEQWSYSPGYPIFTPPVVVDDTVYFGSANLYAIDAKTGQERWDVPIEQGAIQSVTVTHNTAYVGVFVFCEWFCGPMHYLYAVDLSTRQVKWRFDDGPGEAPVIDDRGTVYFSGSALWALDRETGRARWRFQSGGWLQAPTLADNLLYVGDSNGNLYAIPAD